MQVKLWGTRGSLSCFGPDMQNYGGNTSCVEIKDFNDNVLIMDAGTGIRLLGLTLTKNNNKDNKAINILLTHLHLDHIQGLGFFKPLFDPTREVHIYGPATSDREFHLLLSKYLSPPLFPVSLRDLQCRLYLHAVSTQTHFKIGNFNIAAQSICHPGFTVGYRVKHNDKIVAYLPDHEPIFGEKKMSSSPEWISGYDLAYTADLLLHDTQYDLEEYKKRIGWGHSAAQHALEFAKLAKVKKFVSFHHDPGHSDKKNDEILTRAIVLTQPHFNVEPGKENMIFDV